MRLGELANRILGGNRTVTVDAAMFTGEKLYRTGYCGPLGHSPSLKTLTPSLAAKHSLS